MWAPLIAIEIFSDLSISTCVLYLGSTWNSFKKGRFGQEDGREHIQFNSTLYLTSLNILIHSVLKAAFNTESHLPSSSLCILHHQGRHHDTHQDRLRHRNSFLPRPLHLCPHAMSCRISMCVHSQIARFPFSDCLFCEMDTSIGCSSSSVLFTFFRSRCHQLPLSKL